MRKMRLVMLILIISLTGMQKTFSQAGPNCPKENKQGCIYTIPDLSDTQKTEIEKLKVAHMKNMQNLQNQIGEKEAKLKTLETSDNPDMKAINGLVEEIGSIKTDILKERVNHRLNVRKLLTEEQKVYFDAHYMKRDGCMKKGDGYGHGHNCPNGRQ